MPTLDEIDLEILRLLVEDARRPYSDIAGRVDVSAPTVSDRIDRLEALGVIESFTVDLNRTTVSDGITVLIDIELRTADDGVTNQFAALEEVEHVFATTDARLLAVATIATDRIRTLLGDGLDLDAIDSYRVHLIDEHVWAPTVDTSMIETV